jgi:hypothetical protein
VPDCYVNCNAYCGCVQPDGANCSLVVSRAPSPAPPTAAPIAQVCLELKNTNICPQLMERVPSNNFFDCYNFCGGLFLSACEFGGTCGKLDCDNATASGIDSLVLGCTDADRGGGDGGTGTGTSGANLLSWLTSSIAATSLGWLILIV